MLALLSSIVFVGSMTRVAIVKTSNSRKTMTTPMMPPSARRLVAVLGLLVEVRRDIPAPVVERGDEGGSDEDPGTA